MTDRSLVAVSVLSLLGTLGLYGYCVLVPPELLTSPGPADKVGRYVAVEGLVREVYSARNGDIHAELLPQGRPPGVWLVVPGEASWAPELCRLLLTGARVRAEGVVGEYNGEFQLSIRGAGDVRLLGNSSLELVWGRPDLLNNTSVCFAGLAFYKDLYKNRLTFRLLDRYSPSLELNCSSSSYKITDERPRWENGTLVKVSGRLKYTGTPPSPRLYLAGGAAGVEPLG